MPEAWIPSPEIRLRIAAALLLADKKPAEVAPELNISARTLERVIAGDRLPREWEVQRLATILHVPLWFLLEGLAGAARPSEDDRLSELERLVREVNQKLDRVLAGESAPLAAAVAGAERTAELVEAARQEPARRTRESG